MCLFSRLLLLYFVMKIIRYELFTHKLYSSRSLYDNILNAKLCKEDFASDLRTTYRVSQ